MDEPSPECLIFALYSQSVPLLVLIAVGLLRIGDPLDDILKLAYFVGYVGLAAKSLWEPNIFAVTSVEGPATLAGDGA